MSLFVFDVDGTLIDRDQVFKKSTIKSLEKLLKEDNIVAIASGRSYFGIRKFFDCVNAPKNKKYCICTNGSEVTDYDGNTLFKSPLKLKDYKDIFKFFENDDNVVCFCYYKNFIGYFKESDFLDWECNSNNMKPLKFFKNDDDNINIEKVICFSSKLNYFSTLNIDNKFNEKYNIVQSSRYFLEFEPKGIDKSAGVYVLKEHLNIDEKDIYTFGDAGNDLEMIKKFNGIAMGNAIDDVKKVAKYVTLDVKEDGISYALKNILKVIK